MPPTSGARPRDGRTLAALGLAAGITVPAALLGGPQAAALQPAPVPPSSASAADLRAPVAAVRAADADDEQPVCGDPKAKDFPIETRIQDAPDRYASGGGYGTWFLDLTNTTDTSCQALHPVLVLADRDRRLTSDQIQLEFSEPGSPAKEHRVTWESTDRDEQIGVFGDPFPGFTVPAGETVSVRIREPDGPRTERPDPERTAPGTGTRTEHPDPERTAPGTGTERPGHPDGPRTDSGTGRDPAPRGDVSPRPPTRPDAGEGDGDDRGEESPGLPARDGLGRPLPELARTGPASTAWAGAAAGALLLAGTVLLRYARRARRNA